MGNRLSRRAQESESTSLASATSISVLPLRAKIAQAGGQRHFDERRDWNERALPANPRNKGKTNVDERNFSMATETNQQRIAKGATALAAGTSAPDFKLHSTPDQLVSLSDFRGSPVILAFYPADWSPVCGDQMTLYNEILPEFHRHSAALIGISVDGSWCHTAFSKDRKLHFPLLADFEPKGDVARTYGVYRPQDGVCERALFVIDGEGMIAWSYVSPIGVNPGADGILIALEGLAPGQKDKA
jgi:peroxiredoxin